VTHHGFSQQPGISNLGTTVIEEVKSEKTDELAVFDNARWAIVAGGPPGCSWCGAPARRFVRNGHWRR
jgi:hypothetical protein